MSETHENPEMPEEHSPIQGEGKLRKHTIYLSDRLWHLLRIQAAREGRYASDIVRKACRRYVEDEGVRTYLFTVPEARLKD